MISGIIVGLVVAWFLSLFGVDDIVVQGFSELFNISVSSATYYILFALIGIISGLTSKLF